MLIAPAFKSSIPKWENILSEIIDDVGMMVGTEAYELRRHAVLHWKRKTKCSVDEGLRVFL